MAADDKQPELIADNAKMRAWSRSMRSKGSIIAFVPTMGYLHEGHLSLIRQARRLATATVVSIYVNPAQFAPSEDLSTYPSDFQSDLLKLAAASVDAVFRPSNLYDYGGRSVERSDLSESGGEGKAVSCVEVGGGGGGHETWVRVEKLETGLCGKSRPVFFRGVATVVAKLFNIVDPDVAVFGKKDYQQWRVICKMVRDLDFGIQIVGGEIMREPDGLAMSSRNVRLSAEEREKALSINRSLLKAKTAAEKGQASCRELRELVSQAIIDAGGRLDYAQIVDQEDLHSIEEFKSAAVFCVAAWFGNVRLIDNMEISVIP